MGLTAILNDFISREQLPASFRDQAQDWLLPLARDLVPRIRTGQLRVLGISGSQGSGKSTLAALLAAVFEQDLSLSVVVLSLDDFYLSRAERQRLARQVHPLLQTRGVPGTHDIDLACATIERLLHSHGPVALPRFDKARDDRVSEDARAVATAPVDLVILEGWCLAVPPQTDAELTEPVNRLERDEDSDGGWRKFANRALAEHYPRLFDLMDYLIFLRAPDFDAVGRWRRLQEQKLARNRGCESGHRIMDDAALDRFMQHYERLTRHALNTVGNSADIQFTLDDQQTIVARHDR